MKKTFVLIACICFLNIYSYAQHLWSNFTTPASYGGKMAIDHSGNIYTVGSFRTVFDVDPGPGVSNLTPFSAYQYDAYLSKYDANGNFTWAKSFGGPTDDYAYTISIDAADNIYIGGSFQKTVDFDPGPGVTSVTADANTIYSDMSDGFISKFNTNGDFIWVRTIGGTDPLLYSSEMIRDLTVDAAGNIFAVGLFGSSLLNYTVDLDPGAGTVSISQGNSRINSFIVNLDGNGNYINGVALVSSGTHIVNPVRIAISNNAVYFCTNEKSPFDVTQHGESVINKYDLNLNLVWSDTLAGTEVDINTMDIDDQGNVFVGGVFDYTVDFDPGPGVYNINAGNSSPMFMCKLDNNGALQWVNGFPGITDGSVGVIRVNPQTGDCFISGSIHASSGYLEPGNPYSYLSVSPPWPLGFIEQMDASGNFKAVYPFNAVTAGSGAYGGAGSILFDQSGDMLLRGTFTGEIDFDPGAQGVYIQNAPAGGTFISKWSVRAGINYYNTKANLGLENLGTWSTTPDGTGPSPQNFSGVGDQFNVISQANATLSGVISLDGINSKLIIGDAVNPITVTVPAGTAYISHTTSVDVLNNASLVLRNNVVPALKNMANGSYVEFAQSGTSTLDSIKIPVLRYYNLKLTGGLKNFDIGTTIVANDLIADAVVNLGGTQTSDYANKFCYLECLGNVTFLNGTAFEPESAAAKERRFALKMNGPGPVQTITSNGTDIMLVGLWRTASSVCNVVLSPGTNIYFGSAHGGGLSIKPANATLSCTGGSINFRDIRWLSGNADSGRINSNGTSFNILGQPQYNYYFSISAVKQILKFVPGSTINNLSLSYTLINSDYIDPIHIEGNITVTGQLSLASGYIDVSTGTTMSLSNTATLNPVSRGSASSFIHGAVSKTGASDFYFPLGNLGNTGPPNFDNFPKFAPVELSNLSASNTYTVSYEQQGYPVSTIDPATLQVNPDYVASSFEYWNISPTIPGGSADIRFYYYGATSHILIPSAISIAHFDGTDWNSIGGTDGVANTVNSGNVFVPGVSTFSPFTFGGAFDNIIIPVKLTSFTARKEDKVVKLKWTTEQEINSRSFVVERSTDQHSWNEINRLNAAGNSFLKINYTTTDFNPAKGLNYYRLKQIDLDGKFNYSEIRSVYFGNDVNIVLVPNPAVDKVTVYLPGNTTNVSIQVFNANGQLMKTISTTAESIQIKLTGFSKGIYNLKINGKHLNEVRKLLVQ